MSHTTSRSVGGDKLAVFLQQTLGTLAEGYVVSLAELSYFKEERHQKELLNLKQDLKVKDNELTALRKKLEKAEADLVLTATKITDMEDAVSKLLSKVTIPRAMIGHMILGESSSMELIDKWGCREGGLIRPDHDDVVKVDSDWLGWNINGFLMSKLKKEGESVLKEGEQIAKYVNLD